MRETSRVVLVRKIRLALGELPSEATWGLKVSSQMELAMGGNRGVK